MKQLMQWMMAWAVCLLIPSCSRGDDDPITDAFVQPNAEGENSKGTDDDNGAEPKDTISSTEKAYITDSVTYPKYPLLRNMNFVYPSQDPYGKPVMLSGTITMSRDLTPETKAQGFILYNHYTVFRADECPSKGKLDMQNILYLTAPHRNFITVSADYYGFGQTEDSM